MLDALARDRPVELLPGEDLPQASVPHVDVAGILAAHPDFGICW